MSGNKKEYRRLPPDIGPYVLAIVLMLCGLWCLRDGWLFSRPDIRGYVLALNRIGSLIFLPWALFDFLRTWRIERSPAADTPIEAPERRDDPQL